MVRVAGRSDCSTIPMMSSARRRSAGRTSHQWPEAQFLSPSSGWLKPTEGLDLLTRHIQDRVD